MALHNGTSNHEADYGVPPAPGYKKVIQPGSVAAKRLAEAGHTRLISLLGVGDHQPLGATDRDENDQPVEIKYNDLFAEDEQN